MWYIISGFSLLVFLILCCLFLILKPKTNNIEYKESPNSRVSLPDKLIRYCLVGLLCSTAVCLSGIICLLPLGRVTTVLVVIPEVEMVNIESVKVRITEIVEECKQPNGVSLQFFVQPHPANKNVARVSVHYTERTSILTKASVKRRIEILRSLLQQKMDSFVHQ